MLVGTPFNEPENRFVAEHDLSQKIISVVGCDDNELNAFYSAAELLFFPSFAEGFGWPIIEAQAAGCRVVTTNASPMRDLGGPSAVLCNPRHTSETAEVIKTVLSENDSARAQRITDGLRNASRYSTSNMIESYVRLYRTLLTQPCAASQ